MPLTGLGLIAISYICRRDRQHRWALYTRHTPHQERCPYCAGHGHITRQQR